MTLLLDDAAVRAHCDIGALVETLEQGLAEEAQGDLVMPARMNIEMRHGLLRLMPVAMNARDLFGFKVFHTSTTGVRYLVAVYEQEGGELLALVDADYLTAARTGATAGVAAKHLAREDAHVVGVIGSGVEARTNLAAMIAVRPVDEIRVFSPRPARREQFAQEIQKQHGIAAEPVASAQTAADGADIVVVATNTLNAPDPIAFRAEWMQPGMHVSSIGATLATLRELSTDCFSRADVVVVDAADEQMREECGDVVAALRDGTYSQPGNLADLVAGHTTSRTSSDEITLFKSVGTAMQDILAGLSVYQSAKAAGVTTAYDLLHLKAFAKPMNLVEATSKANAG